MRVVIQRVSSAAVKVDSLTTGKIGIGLLVFVGIEDEDGVEDIHWACNKIANMRIFNDANGIMNLSVKDVGGQVLVVSQFTLHASTKKGNRPSYIKASKAAIAIPIYQATINKLEQEIGSKIETGIFGADMKVELTNDGPVTILMDSKNKE